MEMADGVEISPARGEIENLDKQMLMNLKQRHQKRDAMTNGIDVFEGDNGNSGVKRSSLRFPLVTRSVGDRALARQIARLSRPWDARSGEVYAIERRVEIDAGGAVSFAATEVGYWKKGRGRQSDMSVSIFDLPSEELKRVAPLVALSFEDNRHAELVSQHIQYHHETRGDLKDMSCRPYVCLSFWGGMLVIEEAAFDEFCPGDNLVPELRGGFGFGFIWREVARSAVSDAFLDADIILGRFVTDRLYPGMPEPVPVGRSFGVSTYMDDQFLF